MLKIGHVIDCAYRVERLLASGSDAEVYLVTHTRFQRKYALKVLMQLSEEHRRFRGEFWRKTQILATIDHPNLVNIICFKMVSARFPYVVMELLDGENLAQFLKHTDKPLTVTETVHICQQVAAALQSAHSFGIVHGNLKLSNIFLYQGKMFPGFIKVLGWGVEKLPASRQLPSRFMNWSTPSYQAPEQISGADRLDYRADTYSLGVILHELLSGNLPIPTDDALVLSQDPPPLLQIIPEIPPRLARLVQSMIIRQPEARITMKQVLDSLCDVSLPGPSNHLQDYIDGEKKRESGVPARYENGQLPRNEKWFIIKILTLIMLIFTCALIWHKLVYIHPSESSVITSSSYDHVFAKLIKGWFSVDAPNQMRVGVPVMVRASAIQNQFAKDLLLSEIKNAYPQIYQMRFGDILKVELKSVPEENFEVVSLSSTEQPMLHDEITSWEWRVVPKRAGDNRILELTAASLVDANGKFIPKSYPARTIIVKVLVNPNDPKPRFGRYYLPARFVALILVVFTSAFVGFVVVLAWHRRRSMLLFRPLGTSSAKPKTSMPLRLCCHYADRDKDLVAAFQMHLAPLIQQGIIAFWCKSSIAPGGSVAFELDNHMQEADLIALLVSPDFMVDCIDWLDVAMARHRSGSASVIPILLRPTDVEGTPFGDLQSLPKDRRPVTTWPNPDEAWLDIVQAIRQVSQIGGPYRDSTSDEIAGKLEPSDCRWLVRARG